MYYEPYQKKKSPRQPRRRRKTLGGWLAELCLRLLALVLILILLCVGLLYALPVSLFAVEPEDVDLSLTDGLPASRANILLLGLDELRENSRRSDTVMIVVNIPGYGADKLNAAYAHGGPQLVMKTLNQAFGLNLMHYIAVDYAALAGAVDALGGVDVPLLEAELSALNDLIDGARARLAARGYTAPDLVLGGETTHLNGVQALAYARIRKLDSDFMRASRQRTLLEAMLKKVRSSLWNPLRLIRLARALLDASDTNLSLIQLLSLGEKALAAGVPEQKLLPVDGSYTDDGSALRVDDFPANAEAFRAFAYD